MPCLSRKQKHSREQQRFQSETLPSTTISPTYCQTQKSMRKSNFIITGGCLPETRPKAENSYLFASADVPQTRAQVGLGVTLLRGHDARCPTSFSFTPSPPSERARTTRHFQLAVRWRAWFCTDAVPAVWTGGHQWIPDARVDRQQASYLNKGGDFLHCSTVILRKESLPKETAQHACVCSNWDAPPFPHKNAHAPLDIANCICLFILSFLFTKNCFQNWVGFFLIFATQWGLPFSAPSGMSSSWRHSRRSVHHCPTATLACRQCLPFALPPPLQWL